MYNFCFRYYISYFLMIELIIKRDVIELLNDILIKSEGK